MADPNEAGVPVSAGSLPRTQPPISSKDSDHDVVTSVQTEDIRLETEKRMKEEAARREAEKKLKKAELSDLAREHFHSHAGIIYVSEDLWTKLRPVAGPCHLYVALENLEKASAEPGQSSGYLRDKGPPKWQNTTTSPPPRACIMNRILHRDMNTICGFKGDSFLFNPMQAAPFRGMIPFEKAFRQRHLQAEEKFSELAMETPTHRDVMRQELDWVPESQLYEKYPIVSVDPMDEDDKVAEARILRDGYRALIHLLDHELDSLVQDHRLIEAGTVEKLPFFHLWHLFKPGQEIVTNDTKPQAYRVLQVTGGRKLITRSTDKVSGATQRRTISNLVIDCFHLDFDGQEFGPSPVTITIKPYQGSKAIRQLAAYPLALAAEPHLSQILTERGRKFEGLVEASHRKYNGLSLLGKEPFDTLEEIDGDVMVDFKLAYRSNEPLRKIDAPKFYGGVIDEPTQEDEAETTTEADEYDGMEGGRFILDNGPEMRELWAQWSRNTDLLDKRSPRTLSAECYNLLPARVWGYVFLRRKWYPLDIELIQHVQTNNAGVADGFDKLVLPPGHKDIVRALVRTHAYKAEGSEAKAAINMQREFDIVKGKGKGLIILLHGAPGVGKTSTAECVAANAGKPLFPITIGDVGGDSAQKVEENLEKYFDFARKWNCVLLLDEADVFLSTRVAGNITQNSLVSVFLRALEYYSGILILTTNRVGSFDEAIKSRVHCALYYPPLDKDQTIRVWRMNLDSLEERNSNKEQSQRIQFDRGEIEEFARRHWKKGKHSNRWNGRQIKNAFQTAVALADWDNHVYTQGMASPNGTVLKPGHFEKVAVASEHFDMYLERTRTSDQQRAREEAFREDNVGSKLSDASESDDETESEDEPKKKRKTSKKSSSKKGKGSKEKKSSKPKKKREQESDEDDGTEESESGEET